MGWLARDRGRTAISGFTTRVRLHNGRFSIKKWKIVLIENDSRGRRKTREMYGRFQQKLPSLSSYVQDPPAWPWSSANDVRSGYKRN